MDKKKEFLRLVFEALVFETVAVKEATLFAKI